MSHRAILKYCPWFVRAKYVRRETTRKEEESTVMRVNILETPLLGWKEEQSKNGNLSVNHTGERVEITKKKCRSV